MKLLLHIGTDKTGSTAIQRHLYANRPWFLARGVYVPLTGLGKDNGHGNLLADLDAPEMERLVEEIASARESGYTHTVISWEGLCYLDSRNIAKLGKVLAGENLWLLVYLREQADIVQTGYLQEIKTDKSPVGIQDFQGFIWRLPQLRALRYCHSPMRNYARLLQQWMTIIPRGQVIAREYQRGLLIGRSVIDDFLAAMKLSPDDEFIRFTTNTNISLDVESAVIVNEMDRLADPEPTRKACILSLLSIIHSDGLGHRYFLSRRRVAAIRWYYRRSNRAIGELIGSPLPQLFSRATPCARAYTAQDLRASVERKHERIAALQSVPMLFTTKLPHHAPSPEILASGWGRRHDWGTWSAGAVSELYFRVPFWMISHEPSRVIIFIKGRYFPGSPTQSRIVVNNLDFGWLDLRRFTRSISLPVSALGPNQTVIVQVHHVNRTTCDNDRQASAEESSAFGIEKFGIQIIHPE